MAIIASIIFAAGKGSRMTGYTGNKTLLPLIPGKSLFEGDRPLIREVLDNLPSGPKGIVVNHCADEVRNATRAPGIDYIHQPETNGTGGALLSARPFLKKTAADAVIITMGDVPLIRADTYKRLLEKLDSCKITVLAFAPQHPAQYGMLEMDDDRVAAIVEWKYWSDPKLFPPEKRSKLKYCNAGVYAAQRDVLLDYMEKLERRPHEVLKMRDGRETVIKEYFLTDILEMMYADGLRTGVILTPEEEVVGVDTPESLRMVQKIFSTCLQSV